LTLTEEVWARSVRVTVDSVTTLLLVLLCTVVTIAIPLVFSAVITVPDIVIVTTFTVKRVAIPCAIVIVERVLT
jgi:hypothetical protein